MGLDVYIVKSYDAQGQPEYVSWDEAKADFPFQPITEQIDEYDEYGEWMGIHQSGPYIAEINGPMWIYGSGLSFRGRAYEDYPFLTYSFHGSCDHTQLVVTQSELHKFLEENKDKPPEWGFEEPDLRERIERIRWFSTFINWIIVHGYTLEGYN